MTTYCTSDASRERFSPKKSSPISITPNSSNSRNDSPALSPSSKGEELILSSGFNSPEFSEESIDFDGQGDGSPDSFPVIETFSDSDEESIYDNGKVPPKTFVATVERVMVESAMAVKPIIRHRFTLFHNADVLAKKNPVQDTDVVKKKPEEQPSQVSYRLSSSIVQ